MARKRGLNDGNRQNEKIGDQNEGKWPPKRACRSSIIGHRVKSNLVEIRPCRHAIQWQEEGHPRADFLAKLGLQALQRVKWDLDSRAQALVKEFILNYNIDTNESSVRGKVVHFNAGLISEALGISNEGMDPSKVAAAVVDPSEFLKEGWKDESLSLVFRVIAEAVEMKVGSSETAEHLLPVLARAARGEKVNWAGWLYENVVALLDLMGQGLVAPFRAGPLIVHLLQFAFSKDVKAEEMRLCFRELKNGQFESWKGESFEFTADNENLNQGTSKKCSQSSNSPRVEVIDLTAEETSAGITSLPVSKPKFSSSPLAEGTTTSDFQTDTPSRVVSLLSDFKDVVNELSLMKDTAEQDAKILKEIDKELKAAKEQLLKLKKENQHLVEQVSALAAKEKATLEQVRKAQLDAMQDKRALEQLQEVVAQMKTELAATKFGCMDSIWGEGAA